MQSLEAKLRESIARKRARHPSALMPKGRSAALASALVVSAMLATAVALRAAKRSELLAHRVVVVADGCGAECSDRLAHALAANLRALGFDAAAAPAQTGRGPRGAEATRHFGRDRGARSAIMIALAIKSSAALAGDGGRRVVADATLYVMDAAHVDAPKAVYALRSVEEADDERAALQQIARRTLQALFPVAADALLTMDAVVALQTGTRGLEQQAAAIALHGQQRALRARREAMQDYRRLCEANATALTALEGAHCVSAGCGREYAVAMLPDGSAAIVHDSTDLASFPFERDSTARRLSMSERLWLVPRAGPRRLLAEAAHFSPQPDLSRDGRVLSFVEQRPSHTRLYVLQMADLGRRLVLAATTPREVTAPRLNRDGSRVLFFELDGESGRMALGVAHTQDGRHSRHLSSDAIDARWVELSLTPDAPKRTWVAALVPEQAARAATGPLQDAAGAGHVETTLLLFDPESGHLEARVPLREHGVHAIGDADGEGLLLSWQDATCGFARYRPGREVEWFTTALCPEHIGVGRSGVFAHARVGGTDLSHQLVRIDMQTHELEVVTHGALEARDPQPAAQAGGLVYERVLPRRYGELQHVAVCFGDQNE